MAVPGLITPIQFANEQYEDLSAATLEYFIDRTPLIARLPRVQGDGEIFDIISYENRAITGYTITVAITDAGATSATVNDNTSFMVGDVIRIGAEDIEITALNANGTGITIRRGRGGSTASTHLINAPVTLVSNSRTGAEVNQAGTRQARTRKQQAHQTFMFPVQVGGKTQAIRNSVLPAGFTDVFGHEAANKFQEMVESVEYSTYVGRFEKPAAAGDRAKQAGIRYQIDSANLTTSPTNAGSYKPTDLVRDTFEKAALGGGNPNILLCGLDWMTAFALWGYNQQWVEVGETKYGTPIKAMYVPFLPSEAYVVPSMLFPAKSAVALTAADVSMSHLRQERWQMVGRRGDAVEGDWLCDFGVRIEHFKHHAWVEGITAFAKQA
jgi:hypothetical protein